MDTTTMTPGLRAAALKREKNAAAKSARIAGKIAAADKRALCEAVLSEKLRKGREDIDKKIQAARKALGLRKNDPNPSSLLDMKQQMEFDILGFAS